MRKLVDYTEKKKAGSLVNSICQTNAKQRKDANLKRVIHKLLDENTGQITTNLRIEKDMKP